MAVMLSVGMPLFPETKPKAPKPKNRKTVVTGKYMRPAQTMNTFIEYLPPNPLDQVAPQHQQGLEHVAQQQGLDQVAQQHALDHVTQQQTLEQAVAAQQHVVQQQHVVVQQQHGLEHVAQQHALSNVAHHQHALEQVVQQQASQLASQAGVQVTQIHSGQIQPTQQVVQPHQVVPAQQVVPLVIGNDGTENLVPVTMQLTYTVA